jgi:hypothetical protein
VLASPQSLLSLVEPAYTTFVLSTMLPAPKAEDPASSGQNAQIWPPDLVASTSPNVSPIPYVSKENHVFESDLQIRKTSWRFTLEGNPTNRKFPLRSVGILAAEGEVYENAAAVGFQPTT